jgi:alpha-beta hydrolase superfamily lysophospholipase
MAQFKSSGERTINQGERLLVVYVPGGSHSPQHWEPLVNKLKQDLGGEWFGFDHGLSLFSFRHPLDVARELSAFIAAHFANSDSQTSIILVGHSMGGLLVRAAYLMASGALGAKHARYQWPSRVRRIVLLASMDRGVGSDSLRARIGLPIIKLLSIFKKPFVYHLFRGSVFVTNLRISWIRYFRALQALPEVAQILGTRDDEVSFEDCLDSDQFPYATLIEVPGVGHVELHDLSATKDQILHYQAILRGFTQSTSSAPIRKPAESKHRVVILLHGIRASAMDWPSRLSQVIQATDAKTKVIMPSYGYFSARRFAIPTLHRKPLRWFQDAYSQALAEHPDAEICFVGHSNGTYLVAKSLQRISSMKFTRVFLGGCVLPTSFQWSAIMGQVGTVVHAFCHSDFVVAFLCSALRGTGRSDLGTAGFEGFETLPSHQYMVEKGHGAGFDSQEDLQNVASFIVHGDLVNGNVSMPPPRLALASRAMRYAWIPLSGLLIAVAVLGLFTTRRWLGLIADGLLILLVAFILEIL